MATKNVNQEINERMESKGLSKLRNAISNVGKGNISERKQAFAKPVAANVGAGAVAQQIPGKTEAQTEADFKIKYGEADNTASKINRAKHDEDLENAIMGISMVADMAPALAAKAVPLVTRMLTKLSGKKITPEAIEQATEYITKKGFSSHSINPKTFEDEFMFRENPAYDRGYGTKNALKLDAKQYAEDNYARLYGSDDVPTPGKQDFIDTEIAQFLNDKNIPQKEFDKRMRQRNDFLRNSEYSSTLDDDILRDMFRQRFGIKPGTLSQNVKGID